MLLPSLQYYCVKKDVQSSTDYRLILSISFEGERIIFYPGILLKGYEWDRSKKIFINRPDSDALNELLISLKKQVSEIYTSLAIRYGRVTKRHVRDELKKIRFSSAKTLSELFLRFMEDNHPSWTKNTFLKCKSFYGWLIRFIDYYGAFISIEHVNSEFMEQFAQYLARNGLSGRSIYSYLNLFKWFLNRSYDEGLLINTDYRNFRLRDLLPKKNDKADKVFLQHEELMELFLSEYLNRKLEYCRDIFCMIAFTGCSPDEIRNLKKTDIDENFICVYGRHKRKIPLNKYTGEIISKYKNRYFKGGFFFPHYSEMTLNKYIRILAGILRFERTLTIKRKGNIVEGMLKELITIHSARLTFIVNASSLGLPEEAIKLWTGKRSILELDEILTGHKLIEEKSLALINRQYEDTR